VACLPVESSAFSNSFYLISITDTPANPESSAAGQARCGVIACGIACNVSQLALSLRLNHSHWRIPSPRRLDKLGVACLPVELRDLSLNSLYLIGVTAHTGKSESSVAVLRRCVSVSCRIARSDFQLVIASSASNLLGAEMY
jgi:hypothetical protein